MRRSILILVLTLGACARQPATTLEVRLYENLKSSCYEQLMHRSLYDLHGRHTWKFMEKCRRMSYE